MMQKVFLLLFISCFTVSVPDNIGKNTQPELSFRNINMDRTIQAGTELIVRIDTELYENPDDHDNFTRLYQGETVTLIDYKGSDCHVRHDTREGYVYCDDLCTIDDMLEKVQKNKPETYKLSAAADIYSEPGNTGSKSGRLPANSDVIFIACKAVHNDLWNLVIYNGNKTGWINFSQIKIDNKDHYGETVVNGRTEDFYYGDEGSYFEYTFLQKTDKAVRKGPMLVIALNQNNPIYFLDGLSTEDAPWTVLCGKYGNYIYVEERFDEGTWAFFININEPDDRVYTGTDPVFSPGGARFFTESYGPPRRSDVNSNYILKR